jgi:hypothetical protein
MFQRTTSFGYFKNRNKRNSSFHERTYITVSIIRRESRGALKNRSTLVSLTASAYHPCVDPQTSDEPEKMFLSEVDLPISDEQSSSSSVVL